MHKKVYKVSYSGTGSGMTGRYPTICRGRSTSSSKESKAPEEETHLFPFFIPKFKFSDIFILEMS